MSSDWIDHCLNCNERIEYMTDCADGMDRWMHVGTTGDDDPYGPRETRYRECRPPRTVAEPADYQSGSQP